MQNAGEDDVVDDGWVPPRKVFAIVSSERPLLHSTFTVTPKGEQGDEKGLSWIRSHRAENH